MKSSLLKTIYNNFFNFQFWNIGIITKPIQEVVKDKILQDVKWLRFPQKEFFIADPFPITHQGKIYLFFEIFNYLEGIGHLRWAEIDDKGQIIQLGSPKGLADEIITHLSYPFLFKYKNDIYCVPEKACQNEIALYRARSFPALWEKVTVLVKDIAGIDPTIMKVNGHWWLWCTNAKRSSNGELLLWYSDSLTGPWMPHPLNPVKKSLRSSRPAGTPFFLKKHLYRPAQDCTNRYGEKITFNIVTQLSPRHYFEKEISQLEPHTESYYKDGCHTISSVNNITFVDGTHDGFRLDGCIGSLKRLFKKVLNRC